MGMMEPSDTFTMTLRGYQKQALLSDYWDSHGVLDLTNFILQVDVLTGIRKDGRSGIHLYASTMVSVRNRQSVCIYIIDHH